MPFASRLADYIAGASRNSDSPQVRAARSEVSHLKPAVLVTGGSRGIGAALAMRFAQGGADVALVARNAAQLDQRATAIAAATGRQALTIPLDIAAPDAGATLDAALRERGFYADVLINNAGVGMSGPFADADDAALQRLLQLNVAAVTALTRYFLPAMLRRQAGGILTVASLGGAVPGPGQAAYYASKAYALSLSEALASECAGSGVRLCALAPGPADTGFHADMGAETSPYRVLLPAVSLQRIAASGYRGFRIGRRVIVPGLFNTVLYTAVRALPHPISVPFVKVLLGSQRWPD